MFHGSSPHFVLSGAIRLVLLPHNSVPLARTFPGLKIETWGTHRWYNFKRSET